MKTMTVGDLKANFSDILIDIQKGSQIAIAFGRRKRIVAYLVPKLESKKKKRTFGLLKGKASFVVSDQFKISEEDFLNA